MGLAALNPSYVLSRAPRRHRIRKRCGSVARIGRQGACHRVFGTGKVGCCTRGRRGMLEELLPQAERIAAVLKARGETISVAESSTAGLLSAALLAVPG